MVGHQRNCLIHSIFAHTFLANGKQCTYKVCAIGTDFGYRRSCISCMSTLTLVTTSSVQTSDQAVYKSLGKEVKVLA
jgi:hypothetical protein